MRLSKVLLIVFLLSLFVGSVHAEALWQTDSEDGQEYIVQLDDWLSKIALKFYGDMMVYPKIVEATNIKAKEDTSFTTISNPDLIEVGQKLWIPAMEEGTLTDSSDEAQDNVAAEDPQSRVTFVVIGDMPYSDEENVNLTAPDGAFVKAIQAINPPVLIHYGDFKGGSEDCTDALLEARQAQIFALNPYKVVFTPGDNDWTDCDRDNMTVRFDELERLAFLRKLFFEGTGLEMTRDIPDLVRQDGLSENAMWRVDSLVMGTLHIVGTNNGREEILKSDVNQALDAVDERDALNEVWLQQLFESAKSAAGLVILFQADIYRPENDKPACTSENRTDCDGFYQIREAIESMALAYNKPVLVVHGDTNAYCFNQQAEQITNLWHLNGPGDYKVIDAAQVTFSPNDVEPFKVSGVLLEPGEPPLVCDYSR